MGLTINWNIEFTGTAKHLHTKLEKIRQKCMDMAFEEVGEEVEIVKVTQKVIDTWNKLQKKYSFPNNTIENLTKRDREMENLGVTTWQMIETQTRIGLKPTTMVSLYLWPGQGCESAELNFSKIGKKFTCSSFCKTQYAEHFMQCHLLVIRLLDMLKEEGFIIVSVKDEGEYWETRDIKILAKNINDYTTLIGNALGGLQQLAKETGMTIEAPITECQNYMKVDEN